jgi:GT2 family glycosyltransferase
VENLTAVSVLMCVRNVEKYIGNSLRSILGQTFADLEIVIIDEYDSNEKTKKIIESFKDSRIRYFRNETFLGIPKSRNLGVKYAKGDYVFFTDGDCVVSKDWIEEGLKSLKNSNCVGVEGKSYYVSKDYEPTFSDHTYETGCGKFMTNNIAYKRSVIEKVGGFDIRYTYHEDRDIALRILRIGKIDFNPNMIVYVQKEKATPKGLVKHAPILKNRVYLFKKFKDKEFISWRVVDPRSLAQILFPPLVFVNLFLNKFENFDDYKLVPFVYVKAILERMQLWRESAKEGVFLI